MAVECKGKSFVGKCSKEATVCAGLFGCVGGVVDGDAAAGDAEAAGADDVGGDGDEELAGVDFSGFVGALEAGEFAEAGNAFDVAGFIAGDDAGEHGGLTAGDADARGIGTIVEDGNAVDGAAGEGFDFHVERDGDVAGTLDLGSGLYGDAEVFILDLRDGDRRGSAVLREEAGGGGSVDADAGER